jgi:hypothetical protein
LDLKITLQSSGISTEETSCKGYSTLRKAFTVSEKKVQQTLSRTPKEKYFAHRK